MIGEGACAKKPQRHLAAEVSLLAFVLVFYASISVLMENFSICFNHEFVKLMFDLF